MTVPFATLGMPERSDDFEGKVLIARVAITRPELPSESIDVAILADKLFDGVHFEDFQTSAAFTPLREGDLELVVLCALNSDTPPATAWDLIAMDLGERVEQFNAQIGGDHPRALVPFG